MQNWDVGAEPLNKLTQDYSLYSSESPGKNTFGAHYKHATCEQCDAPLQ